MTSHVTEVKEIPTQEVDESTSNQTNFIEKVLRYNAVACSNQRGDNYDKVEAINESIDNLKALSAKGGLQEMLAAQITSLHLLQQKTVALANSSGLSDSRQYYTNSAVKLANSFAQQVTLLAKLQGKFGQKIVVEHVEVHHGGQAVVGSIEGVIPSNKEKI